MTTELTSAEPATGEIFWRGTPGDRHEILDASRTAFSSWSAEPLARRAELLKRFANQVRADAGGLAKLIARETGKPHWEAETEVQAVIGKVDISLAAHAERAGNRVTEGAMGARNGLRHKPHGVMAVLGPYNFPAHLPNGHIVPALLAGNTVVFKPSEKTPAVGERLVSYFEAAGFPKNVIQLLLGGPDEGRALTTDPRIDGVLFTGSSNTGIAIRKQLVERPGVITALEMGGNNPLIVWDTPLIQDTAATIVQSAYTTAGQRCTAARRLIVRDTMYDDVMAALTKLVDKMIVGGPFDQPAPFMGPVIDNQAAETMLRGYEGIVNRGGKVIRPLERMKEGLPFLSPGIVDTTDMERRDEELFGPLLQVIRVSNFKAALTEANNTAYGLSASLVGGTPELYGRFWREIRAGIVNWNRPTNGASSNAPFGGVGLSGNHRPGAYYAADYCSYPVASAEMDQPRAMIGVGIQQ
ncbi:succinylglutamate-semialdehyde dehydrogenase [Croceicoccus mobilis]|uniref:L-glutamate gamma-semialdehyde dehydrogenase n=1 Tax=Croceicoccus mobilis TaxID=1703339 RepID=A0A917DT68_9SPHN|nr:succinylglutamate-semialdehyde dehydrogenase [Croceicoccus mobilis]GGD68661.1 N-succinylglutamate 5-semialdehyde dehydrogenase 1 [Croceicoccus mobilis]